MRNTNKLKLRIWNLGFRRWYEDSNCCLLGLTSCSSMVECEHYGEVYCLHLQSKAPRRPWLVPFRIIRALSKIRITDFTNTTFVLLTSLFVLFFLSLTSLQLHSGHRLLYLVVFSIFITTSGRTLVRELDHIYLHTCVVRNIKSIHFCKY